jgi:hypothetical protein
MSSPIAAFGPGIVIISRTDLGTPYQPINIGYANELSIDESGTTKQLYGQNQYALVAARSTLKSTGKIKAATFSGLAWNAAFYGQSFTSGGVIWNVGETGTVGTGPETYQVTNHATFDSDLGVIFTDTGLPAVCVAASPVAGVSYTQSGGTYTFATGDSGRPIAVTYRSTTTAGQTLSILNKPIGFTPTFQLDYFTTLSQPTPKPIVMRIYSCIGGKKSMGFKLEDFAMPEFDFDFFALSNNKVADYVFPEVS